MYDWIGRHNLYLTISSDKITVEQLKKRRPTLIVSYNYSHIIGRDVIEFMQGRIINLHISLLPWNRGAYPNIWSFIDNTPKGVTIHKVAEGIDTGEIIYQREVTFNIEKETFSTSYIKLHKEIQQLFKEKWKNLYDGDYKLHEQEGIGSYHSVSDFVEWVGKIPDIWEIPINILIKNGGFVED